MDTPDTTKPDANQVELKENDTAATHSPSGSESTETEDTKLNKLKVLRAERDWTQADLANELDVSRQTVNALEKGKFDPSLPLAFKAARLFERPIEEIFQDE